MKKILPLFSYLFHPLFIPVYAALFYFFFNDSYLADAEKYLAILQIVIITIVIPILLFFVFRSLGFADSIMLKEISQRKLPLTIQSFLIILLVRKCITLSQFPELHFFFLGALLSTVIALILLFFKIKASLHAMAMAGLTLFIIGLSIHNQIQNINTIAFFVLINGIVASSRLEMKAHTIKELLIGFVLGFVPQLLLLQVWL